MPKAVGSVHAADHGNADDDYEVARARVGWGSRGKPQSPTAPVSVMWPMPSCMSCMAVSINVRCGRPAHLRARARMGVFLESWTVFLLVAIDNQI